MYINKIQIIRTTCVRKGHQSIDIGKLVQPCGLRNALKLVL